MNRTFLVAVAWAVLLAGVVLLARLAGPEPRAPRSTVVHGPPAGTVARASPAVPRAEPAGQGAPGEAAPAPGAEVPATTSGAAQARPPRPAPSRAQDGTTESGIPGLGGLPPGPGAAYQGLGVQVFSRVTGQPVQGARVRWALEEQLAAWEREHAGASIRSADPEILLQVCEKPLTTRAGGVALAESAPGRMLVDASYGREYGFAWVDRDKDARARIDLVEDRALSVRVVGASEVPRPGATVVVRDASCTELWRGTTDALGTAHWRHASFLIERDAAPGSCTVQVESVEAHPLVHDLRRPFLDPRELVITTTADCVLLVEVTDASGRTIEDPVDVTVRAGAPSACTGFVRRTSEHGVARFEHVGAGLELSIAVDGRSCCEDAALSVPGPARAGELREVTIPCGRRLPSFRARLVDQQHRPLAGASGTAWLEFTQDGRERWLPTLTPFESDGDGRIRFVMPHAPGGTRVHDLLIVARNEYGDWCNAARVPLAAAPGESETDLGEHELEEMPTLAAGYVLSDRDWPVPGGIVEAAASDDPDLDPEAFVADHRFDAVADQLGRFRLRGLIDGSRVALTATAPDHVRAPRQVHPRGERKIALKLTRCASLAGKLLLPNGVSFDRVHVWVEGADETIPAVVDSNLTWRCASLSPGLVDVRVTIDGLDETAFVVPGLTLTPGLSVNDATTLLDLRSHVTRFVFRLLDGSGAYVPEGSVRLIEHREEGDVARVLPFQNGILEVLALRPKVDAEVTADGFETLLARDVDTSRDLRLTRLRKE